jgi:hypothetical protein
MGMMIVPFGSSVDEDENDCDNIVDLVDDEDNDDYVDDIDVDKTSELSKY